MSIRHPIIGVTGSSGAGTSTALRVFERLFAEMQLKPAIVEGDAFHAVDREQNKAAIERARQKQQAARSGTAAQDTGNAGDNNNDKPTQPER